MSNVLTKNLGVVSPVPKGEYNSEASYEKLNIVNYDGSSYIAIKPSTGIVPTNTEYWQFLSGGIRKQDIIDNLESTASDKPLSAHQGKIVNDAFQNSLLSNYYEEITYKKERYYDTDCYFITIPKFDDSGNIILPYVGDGGSNLTPLQYAQKNFTTFTSNGTLHISDTVTSSNSGVPIVIHGGEVIRNHPMISAGVADNYLYLGITSNRTIKEYKVNETTAQTMLDDGCLEVFDIYYKLIENGEALDLTNVVTNESTVVANPNPRIALCLNENEDIIIFACDGRTEHDIGLTSAEMQELFIQKGYVQAWNLDGGGSTNITIRGSKLNRNIDGSGTADRRIRYTLNVKKETNNESIAEAFSKIGEEKQNIIQQLIPIINLSQIKFQDLNSQDLNNITSFTFGFGNRLGHGPFETSNGYVIVLPHVASEWIGKYCTQIFMSRDSHEFYQRRMINEVWTDWYSIYNKSCYIGRWTTQLTKANDDIEFLHWSSSSAATDTGNFTVDSNDNTILEYSTKRVGVVHENLSGILNFRINIEVPDTVYSTYDSIDINIQPKKKNAEQSDWDLLDYTTFSNKVSLLKGQKYATIGTQLLSNNSIGDKYKIAVKAPTGVKISVSLQAVLTDRYI